MSKISSRARVIRTLEHKEPDRVPWDCNFTVGAYLNLMKYLGLEHEGELKPNWGTVVRSPRSLMDELSVELCYINLKSPVVGIRTAGLTS